MFVYLKKGNILRPSEHPNINISAVAKVVKICDENDRGHNSSLLLIPANHLELRVRDGTVIKLDSVRRHQFSNHVEKFWRDMAES